MAQVYHIRTINSVIPPVPAQLKIEEYTLDLESYTTASGLLKRNPVAVKMKFFLTFPTMTKPQLQAILTMLDSEAFPVQYEDIRTGALKTGTFYRGDRSIEVYQIRSEDNTDVLYKPFSINLIEY